MIGVSEGAGNGRAYGAGLAVAGATALVAVWTTIVRDDGNGIGFFMVIMAAVVGGFSGRFQADALARTMAGVAVMQLLLSVAIATAPIVANIPGESFKFMLLGSILAMLWLTSAAFFRSAAKAS